MRTQDNLSLDPRMEEQLQQFQIEQEKVQPYMDHPERLTKFMDFRVDYAFKYILGHKRILMKLINDVFPVQVTDIEYLGNEIPVVSEKEKRATFDVICTERGTGKKFLAEMQCHPDSDMNDRLLFYGCTLVHSQIERGDPTYSLKPVYVLCIANYFRQHTVAVPPGRFFFSYQFRETTAHDDCFTENLQFFFLELPRLRKIWEALETNLERWCYLFENLSNFAEVPKDPAGFEDVFSVARTGTLGEDGLGKYVTTMVSEYDKRVIGEYFRREGYAEGRKEGHDAGRKEGREEGREEGFRLMAEELRKVGMKEDAIRRIVEKAKL